MDENGNVTDKERVRLYSHWGGRAESLKEAAREAFAFANAKAAVGQVQTAEHWRTVAEWLTMMFERNLVKQNEFRDPE